MTADGHDAGRTPWWASGSDGPAGWDEDPLTAHREARRGGRGGRASDAWEASGTSDSREGEPSDVPPLDGWWDAAADRLVEIVRDASDAAHAQALANARRAATGEPLDDEGSAVGHGHDEANACQICPLCTGIRLLGEQRPELLGHVAEAARHLSLAARTLLDGHAGPAGPRQGADDLEHIDLE